ncbi:1,5-anhydro-D-fructose reductase [compost metagenome]
MRIAVLGCGSIGRRHLRNLNLLREPHELLAYDPSEAALEIACQESGAKGFSSLDAIWEARPEIGFITSPSELHVEHALAAVRQGCHVFIEKPLSHSVAGIHELENALAETGRHAMVGCNMRFHPGPATVKRLLSEHAIGTPLAARIQCGSYLPQWRPSQDYRKSYSASVAQGGAILDCIHEIDLALWYLGPAHLVGAAHMPASSIGLATDGLAELILKHESGSLSNVHLNFIQRDYRRTCQIIGTEGTLYWDFAAHRVDHFGPAGDIVASYPEPDGWQPNQMYVDEIAHFLERIALDRPPVSSLAEGWAALSLALSARDLGRTDS